MSKELYESTVIKYFLEISEIPRDSGNEKEISDYIKGFAIDHKLTYRQDELYNIIVKKQASVGYENSAPMILQAHLDMVCEKEAESDHDFLKEPINVYEELGFLRADGTTLGADNGIGVAYILAILADEELSHPEIEAVFTVSEEIGLTGMAGLDVFDLKSKQMINLDSEEEGVLCAACAGGVRAEMVLPLDFETANEETEMGKKAEIDGKAEKAKAEKTAYKLTVSGLEGGHSGVDIHLGRGNAIVMLARSIELLSANFDIKIAGFTGGSKGNAIPREASAILFVDEEVDFNSAVYDLEDTYKKEFAEKEKELSLQAVKTNTSQEKVLTEESKEKLLAAILLSPNGLIYKSPYIEGLTETSSNLGTIRFEDEKAVLLNMVRSNTDSKKTEAELNIKRLARLLGAEVSLNNGYNAWEYRIDSPLRAACLETYEGLYGEKMQVSAIHGGLECAFMGVKIPGIDMVSIGSNIIDVHTPREKAEIASALNVYKYLCEVLKNLKSE